MREYGTVKTAPAFDECPWLQGKNARTRYNKRVKVWDKTGGYCAYCHGELAFGGIDAFHMDHVIPKSRGGTNSIENLLPTCEPCNLSKHAQTPEEWRA